MDIYNLTTMTQFVLIGLFDLPEVHYPLFVVFAIIYQVTLVGNGAILLAIATEKKLHTPMYYFLVNLSLLDIFCPSATVPKMLDNLLTEQQSISFLGCAFQLYFLVALAGTEVFLLAAVAYGWYVAICFPLHYSCIQLTAGTWAAGFLNSLLRMVSTFCLSFCKSNRSVEGKHKAFSTCTSHLLVVSLFHGTAIFTYVRPSSSQHSPARDRLIPMLYGVITPMLNPMIYSLKNIDVKEALRRLLCHRAFLLQL
ncbi:hypothetical protein PANDA_021806, partial [Ailuropoda melanoleuca]